MKHDPPGRPEEIRVRHLYRKLIMQGEIDLPREAAVGLVGPDCAYHVYRNARAIPERPPRGRP